MNHHYLHYQRRPRAQHAVVGEGVGGSVSGMLRAAVGAMVGNAMGATVGQLVQRSANYRSVRGWDERRSQGGANVRERSPLNVARRQAQRSI